MNRTMLWFESLDQLRKLQGKTLDKFGLAPRESAYHIIFSRPGVRLRCYGAGKSNNMTLLIVPAPIKRPYIWDLSPERSVVRRAIEHGFGVYLAEWTEPTGQDPLPGLAEYAGVMLGECIDAIIRRSGFDQVVLAGHSLGGVFAALHSAYRPTQISALVLIEAPLHFAPQSGAFGIPPNLNAPARALHPSSGRIPGSLLGMLSAGLEPGTFCMQRYIDCMASMASRELLLTHWRVERWTMDELPMSRKLFDDVLDQLCCKNQFMRGEMTIGDVRLHPRNITSPLFCVYEPSSHIVPPESVVAFYHAVASCEKELVPYLGDTGVALQHVGGLVGDGAHRHLWPHIFAWLDQIGSASNQRDRERATAAQGRLTLVLNNVNHGVF